MSFSWEPWDTVKGQADWYPGDSYAGVRSITHADYYVWRNGKWRRVHRLKTLGQKLRSRARGL